MKKEPRPPGYKPGDLILNKYMPNATSEEREEARANLKAYVEVMIRIAQRIEAEKAASGIITRMLEGTIVENSLADKKILAALEIVRTWQDGSWTLHRVHVDQNQLPSLAASLADGPWYTHFWEPGKDNIIVVFKNKTFAINASDKSTWTDAIAHGSSLGIPPEQLDFPIDASN